MNGWGQAKASGSAGSSRLGGRGGEAAPRAAWARWQKGIANKVKLVTFVHWDSQIDLQPGSKEKQLHVLGIQMLAT